MIVCLPGQGHGQGQGQRQRQRQRQRQGQVKTRRMPPLRVVCGHVCTDNQLASHRINGGHGARGTGHSFLGHDVTTSRRMVKGQGRSKGMTIRSFDSFDSFDSFVRFVLLSFVRSFVRFVPSFVPSSLRSFDSFCCPSFVGSFARFVFVRSPPPR